MRQITFARGGGGEDAGERGESALNVPPTQRLSRTAADEAVIRSSLCIGLEGSFHTTIAKSALDPESERRKT